MDTTLVANHLDIVAAALDGQIARKAQHVENRNAVTLYRVTAWRFNFAEYRYAKIEKFNSYNRVFYKIFAYQFRLNQLRNLRFRLAEN